jgi:hypothetical protein
MINKWVVFGVLVLFSCDHPKKKMTQENEKVTDGIQKSYRKDGKLLSEVTMKGGKRNGIAKNFFPNGKMSLEMNYVDGKREGKSKRFYEDGKLYSETEYKNDKMNGERKKYRDDGKLMSVSRFENDLPCSGLIEYHLDGTRKIDYPKIVFSTVNNLSEGIYRLKVSLSNGAKSVKFYRGNLTPSGCFDARKADAIRLVNEGVAEIDYDLMPGQFAMEEVAVVAIYKTNLGNDFFVTGVYNLSIRN